MAKGDITKHKVIGSIGAPVMQYDDNNKVVGVLQGAYQHRISETVKFKTSMQVLSGVIKLQEDEYQGNVFFRLLGMVDNSELVTRINGVAEALANVEW